MDGIQGAVLSIKLQHLDAWNNARRTHALTYQTHLPKHVQTIATQIGSESVYHLFVVRVQHREKVQQYLSTKGISTGIHYPIPIHQQPAFIHKWGTRSFPHSEKIATEIISLPMFPELTEEQIKYVCTALSECL